MKSVKTIRVCRCGCPLIWTFAFDYCERYCLNCGNKGGMFGTGEDVPITQELRFKKRLIDSVWNVIYSRKGLVPVSCQTSGCKKCKNSSEKHYDHLTKIQKENDKIAREYLQKFIGVFNNK